ncbi:hypothetical protein ES703_123757 [subsurface metagenome]
MSMDIDKLTDEELEQLLEAEELKCKIDPKTQRLVCATSEDINRAIARLKNPVKQVVFEVTVEPVPEPEPEPVTELPVSKLNPTES